MNLLKNLFVFLLMLGIYNPSYAAVSDFGNISCGVFNDENGSGSDKKDEDKKGTEEEPDCE